MDTVMDDAHVKRDRHLFGPGPKRLLALDGGGVRGAISVAFLAEMERLLRRQEGPEIRLGDWFDLVGGTSTGAVIAVGVALGHDTREIEQFYRERAQRVFRHSFRRIPGLRSRFDAKALTAEIARVVGDRTLDSPDLITGFGLVTKRVDTGSPWIIANNPRAPYWDRKPDQTFIANREYRLSDLLRASTAAPYYFDPEGILVQEKESSVLFVDGGVTPHNNPALILFLMATLKPYGICWPTGADNLTVVSIGTGAHRHTFARANMGFMMPVRLAYHMLSALIADAQTEVLMLMQWLGQSLTPWPINAEVGTLADELRPGGPSFRFVRYDVRLEANWLKDNFDEKLSERQIVRLREMGDPSNIPLAYEIGRQAARKQVRPEHFGLDRQDRPAGQAPAS